MVVKSLSLGCFLFLVVIRGCQRSQWNDLYRFVKVFSIQKDLMTLEEFGHVSFCLFFFSIITHHPSHSIHVWYIYLHLPFIVPIKYQPNAGKYNHTWMVWAYFCILKVLFCFQIAPSIHQELLLKLPIQLSLMECNVKHPQSLTWNLKNALLWKWNKTS